ncbi:MAG: glutathione S-transferase family protein [Allosphingosinicella sp.]
MIVYGSSLSPFVRKVLAFGAEKGIDLELQASGLGNQDPAFREASPFGKMPGFRDPGSGSGAGGEDFCISDSTAIIFYLEAIKPEPNMIPTEPRARARTVWFDEYADTILFACGGKIFFNRVVGPRFVGVPGDEEVATKAECEELPPLLDYLERVIPPSGFLVEDRLTLADISVASPFANLRHLDIAIDPARHPRVKAYVEAILDRPSFKPWIEREAEFLQRTAPASRPTVPA